MATGYVQEVLPTPLNSHSQPPSIFDGTTRLYIYYSCPFAQRVWITRNVKGLQDKIQLVAIDIHDKPDWYKEKVNPANKVPALEHNNKVIVESLDLIKYVDSHFEGPSLFPNSKLDVGKLSLAVESGTLDKIRSDLNSAVPNFHSRLVSEDEAIDFCEDKPSNITSVAEKFETILSPRTPTNQENCDESLCCSKGTSSVKYVNGVAVVLGRTRSLVERFERRERSTDDEDHTTITSPCMMSETDNTSTMLKAQPQISGREPASEDDDKLTEDLMQNHDVFLSTLKSRLTKLQVVRHFWERNDIKGAISAMRKLPDHSVQADVVSAFMEKMEIVTLDLFSCLLPLLIGLLDSQTERHTNVSLEMLLKLVAVFGPVVRSTISAPPVVGVDLQAEHRLECCNQCFIQLQKIQKILPALVRRGGLLARSAQELNFVLQS